MPRSSLNASKNGLTVDDVRKSSNKSTRYKKSILPTAPRKGNTTMKNQDRLEGGADVQESEEGGGTSTASAEKIQEETNFPISEKTTNSEFISEETKGDSHGPPSGPCCFCPVPGGGSTGDKKVDEIIDYVHQNLQEAGKALATLSENFEHDAKLMFVDILGKIQQWSGIAQKKLEICKIEIEALRNALLARICEINDLKSRLNECQTALDEHESPNSQALLIIQQSPSVLSSEVQTSRVQIQDSQLEAGGDALHGGDTSKESKHDAASQSFVEDKDRVRRDLEFGAEISRLSKENEQLLKDRAEYENAIQRALLRGVSCLNVEALRVLRCPPIPCCTPCAPCPGSSNGPESIVPCKIPKDCPAVGTTKSCVSQRNRSPKSAGRDSAYVKRPCGSPCCSGGKSRKSATDTNMLFLLHQEDAANICGGMDSEKTTMRKVCGSPIMKKIEIPPCPRFDRE